MLKAKAINIYYCVVLVTNEKYPIWLCLFDFYVSKSKFMGVWSEASGEVVEWKMDPKPETICFDGNL